MAYNLKVGASAPQILDAKIAWEGDSLELIRSFPVSVREDFGADLRRMQTGHAPLNSRPMKSIGKRVYELKQQDRIGWYRLVYLAKIGSTIYVLHCFRKKVRKTSPNDLLIAKRRLRKVLERIRSESADGRTS